MANILQYFIPEIYVYLFKEQPEKYNLTDKRNRKNFIFLSENEIKIEQKNLHRYIYIIYNNVPCSFLSGNYLIMLQFLQSFRHYRQYNPLTSSSNHTVDPPYPLNLP